MNLGELSIIELKALAYDQIVQLELHQNNLKAVNQELENRLKLENDKQKENDK